MNRQHPHPYTLLPLLALCGLAYAGSLITLSASNSVQPFPRDNAGAALTATNGNPLYYTRSGDLGSVCLPGSSAPVYAKVPAAFVPSGQTDANGASIFNTNIPGIGVSFLAGYGGGAPSLPLIGNQEKLLGNAPLSNGCVSSIPVSIRATYYPTANSGSLSNNSYPVNQNYSGLFFVRQNSTSVIMAVTDYNTQVTLTLQPLTCRLSSASEQTIALPTITAANLMAQGSITPAQTAANFSLSCDNGINQVYATLSDANNSANNNGSNTILSIASGNGMATGVDIAVLRGNDANPAPLGQPLSNKGNPGQWALASYGSNNQISLRAQYVRTGAITPGKVAAQASITFSYQ